MERKEDNKKKKSKDKDTIYEVHKRVILSIGFALLSLTVFYSFRVGSEVQRTLSFQQITDSLNKGAYSETEKELNNLFSKLSSNALYSSTPKELNYLKEKEHQVAIKELLLVVADLQRNNLSPAVLRFFALQDGKLNSILEKGLPTKDAANQINEQFRSLHTKLVGIQELEGSAPERLEELEVERDRLYQIALSMSLRLSDLFSIPALEIEEGESPEEILYSGGALRGLPKLQGIPDEISDLKTLKDLVERNNGQVLLRGENAPQVFRSQLTKIRIGSSRFREGLERVQLEEEELNLTLSEDQKDARELATRLRTGLTMVLLQTFSDQGSGVSKLVVKLLS